MKEYEIDGRQQYKCEGYGFSTSKYLMKKHPDGIMTTGMGGEYMIVPTQHLTMNPSSLYGTMRVFKITETLGSKKVLFDEKPASWDKVVKRGYVNQDEWGEK